MVYGQDLNLPQAKTKRISGVEKKKLLEIGNKMTTIPEGFAAHKTLQKIFLQKKKCLLTRCL